MEDEAALSDFEDAELEAVPVVLPTTPPSPAPATDSSDPRYVDRREDEAGRSLADALEKLDQASRQRDEAQRQAENATRDSAKGKAEIEASAKLLIAGLEKITSLAGDNKGFAGGLARSSQYTGLAAICYGFCKRTEEIVEEVVRQRDSAIKSQNEARGEIEQRNVQIAIEVSQLEASIVRSKEELEKRSFDWEKRSEEKAALIRELEAKLAKNGETMAELEKKCSKNNDKVGNLERDLGSIKGKIVEQMKGFLATEEKVVNFLHRIDGKIVKAVRELPFSDFGDTDRVHRDYVRRVDAMCEMLELIKDRWEEREEIRSKEKIGIEKEMQRLLLREKDMAVFLRSCLSGSRDGVDEESEMQTLANAVDAELRSMRLKVLDLERQLADARMEIEKVNNLSALQSKDLAAKTARIQELEVKHGIVSGNVEGLTAEIAAAEEELVRWKRAATEEAAAGVAILEEVEKCNHEIATLNQVVLHLKQSLEDATGKLESKEEMAAAAIAAGNAAERSLKVADERAGELRERLEEMSRQLEEAEARAERRRRSICGGKLLEVFPWLLIGTRGRDSTRQSTAAFASAEMEELTEPLV